MSTVVKTVFVIMMAITIGLVGCSKKAVKVKPALPEAKAPIEAPKVETPTVTAPEEFKPIDMDAEARKALQTVYFDFDKYDLRSDAISVLEVAARFLQANPSARVLSEGNCDERGSSEYNMGLGENRAKAVKKYLTSYGISADRIETTSYGKERPVKTGCGTDDGCHQVNRRAEWKLLAK